MTVPKKGSREATMLRVRLAMKVARWVMAPLMASTSLVPVAHASSFQLREDSAVTLGSAHAGAASSATTPGTVFDNPAGMTQLDGVQVQLGATFIAPSIKFSGTARSPFGTPVSGRTEVDAADSKLIPNVFATYRLRPDFAIGLAVTTPYGLSSTYPADWVGRYHAIKSDLSTINIQPSLAFQPTPWLSLGAGVSATQAQGQFTGAIDSTAIATGALRRLTVLPDGSFRVKGDDWGFGYNVAALLMPAPGTRIGLTYRSRVIENLAGSADYSVPALLSATGYFTNQRGRLSIPLPAAAALSATQQVTPELSLSADVTWTDWSEFRELDVMSSTGSVITSTPERFRDSWSVALGGSYRLTDRLTLRAGTAFDKTPVTEAYRTARVPDESRYWLAGGLSYQVLPSTTLDLGYAHLFSRPTAVREISPTGEVLTGRYGSSVDLVAVGSRLKF